MSASNSTPEVLAAGLEKPSHAPNLQQTIVKLNVGGVLYEASLSTLLRYPESMFATWFAKWKKENQEEYFVDFDGEIFKFILDFLRYGESGVLPSDEQSLQRLRHAADYFQLPQLQHHLSSLIVDKHGVRGNELPEGQMVKFSRYGADTCCDSFVVSSLRIFTKPHMALALNGTRVDFYSHLLGITAAFKYGCAITCPECGIQTGPDMFNFPEPSLAETLKTSRDVFRTQMWYVVLTVETPASMRECDRPSDCAVVCDKKLNKYYHIAKRFLTIVEQTG